MRLRRTGKRGNKVRSRNTRKRQTLRRKKRQSRIEGGRKKRQSRIRGGAAATDPAVPTYQGQISKEYLESKLNRNELLTDDEFAWAKDGKLYGITFRHKMLLKHKKEEEEKEEEKRKRKENERIRLEKMTDAERKLHNRMIELRESQLLSAARMYTTPTPEKLAEEEQVRDYWRKWNASFKNKTKK